MEPGPRRVMEVLAEIEGTRSRPELSDLLLKLVSPYGFTHVAIGSFAGTFDNPGDASSSKEPFLLNTWPRAWLETYARLGLLHNDPVIAQVVRSTEPFTWSELRARQPGQNEALFAAAADYGWRDGFAVPIPDSENSSASVGVTSFAAAKLVGFDVAGRSAVIAIAKAAFHRARALATAEPSADILTARERQSLRLVADGCSDAEIGQRLGVSRTTAHFHVEQAKKKLGAVSRSQAVALALSLGLI